MAFRQLDFTFAYDFADRVVRAVYAGGGEKLYLLDHLDGCEGSFCSKIAKPSKDTLLHEFIRSINLLDLDYATGHFPEETIEEFRSLIVAAGFRCPYWLTRDRVRDHIRRLDMILEGGEMGISPIMFPINGR